MRAQRDPLIVRVVMPSPGSVPAAEVARRLRAIADVALAARPVNPATTSAGAVSPAVTLRGTSTGPQEAGTGHA